MRQYLTEPVLERTGFTGFQYILVDDYKGQKMAVRSMNVACQ